jgi:hypothetical protein
MNSELDAHFRFIHRLDGYPPFRVTYAREARIQTQYEEYSGEFFLADFGSGWEFFIEAIDHYFDQMSNDRQGSWLYLPVATGLSKTLEGAYLAARGLLPREAWPFVSHQLMGRRERFYFAYEFELANGPEALHQEMESGWLEEFRLNEKSLDGDPPCEWERYDE